MLPVYYPYVTCMLPVCYLYVTCTLPVCYLYVTCTLPAVQVGEKVWIARGVSEPARGWAGVSPISIVTLISVHEGEVDVNFPECSNWKGSLAEIERVRPITVGDKVRVSGAARNVACGLFGRFSIRQNPWQGNGYDLKFQVGCKFVWLWRDLFFGYC